MTARDGGAALPASGSYHPDAMANQDNAFQSGMSLRDRFAGQAMAALVRRAVTNEDWARLPLVSYEIADAMLAARTEGGADNG